MKAILGSKVIMLLTMAVVLSNCKDDEAIKVYMPSTTGTAIVKATFDVLDTVKYTATIVGADYPTASLSSGSDVTVDFKIDSDKIASFNQSMGTDYQILPSNNFSFETTGTIVKGSSGTMPLNLIIKNGEALDPFSSYLLPISIDKVNGGSVGEAQQTTYFVLTRSPSIDKLEKFDRTLWTILDKSSEEPGEGNGNGLAVDAIDGNLGSYWHTKWAGSEPPPPHFIKIDMGEETMIHGIAIVARDLKDWAHGQPKSIKVSVSTDGETFTDVGTAQPLDMGTDPVQVEQRFFLSTFKTARYFKITILSTWGGTNSSSVAEIYAL